MSVRLSKNMRREVKEKKEKRSHESVPLHVAVGGSEVGASPSRATLMILRILSLALLKRTNLVPERALDLVPSRLASSDALLNIAALRRKLIALRVCEDRLDCLVDKRSRRRVVDIP